MTAESLLTVILVLWTTAAISAEDAIDCSKPSNTPTINACLKNDVDQADRVLNNTYKELLSNLEDAEKDWLRPKGALVEPIKKSQRAWVSFRDANCGYYYEQVNGTAAAAADLICRRRMTEERNVELKKMFMGSP